MQGEPRRSLKKVVVSPENVRFLLLSIDAHILHAESHIRWKKSFVGAGLSWKMKDEQDIPEKLLAADFSIFINW